MKKSPTQEPPMSENEKLREARQVYADYGARKATEAGSEVDDQWVAKVLAGDADDTHGVQIALAALSTPPSKADADDVERVATAFAEALYGEQFDPFIEPEAYAHVEEATRTVLSAIQNRDAGLREAGRNLLPYLKWTIGPESPGHHPTMPSAVAAFEAALLTEGENHG